MARRGMPRSASAFDSPSATSCSTASRVCFGDPVVSVVTRWYDALIRATAIWSGTHILHLTAAQLPVIPTGSGDGMVAWMENLLYVAAAVVACAVWTIADRKRTQYRKLNEWLNIYVRFTLAFVLFGYGFAKIIPNQFPYPTLEKLSEPLGEFSPMGLLWTFMGYSPAYNFFTGMGEALGGLLVCFRRTTTAGALLAIAVLSNVVFLNFTYDVPVKLYSANLLLMAVFLTIPDMRRLLNVLLLNRPTQARNLQPLYRTRAMERTSFTLRALLVAYTAGMQLSGKSRAFTGRRMRRYRSCTGFTDMQSLTRGGKDVPLVVTDGSLWRRVIFSRFDRLSIRDDDRFDDAVHGQARHGRTLPRRHGALRQHDETGIHIFKTVGGRARAVGPREWRYHRRAAETRRRIEIPVERARLQLGSELPFNR